MKLFELCFSALGILCCCCVVFVRGHGVCTVGKLISRINLSTELHSEILLPCLFEQAVTGSNLTMNSAADWTQINITIDYIVEIKINGYESFWNNRHNRIKVFRDAAVSGNFSILIRDVQQSDLGLYRCELFRDINCSLGYREISLGAVKFSVLNNWLIAAGGGFLLLCLIAVCVYCMLAKRRAVQTSVDRASDTCYDVDGQNNDEITYASVVHKSRNCHDSKGQNNDEITYASVVPKSHNRHDSEGQKNDEIPYATVLKSHNCHDSKVLLSGNSVNSSASGLISSEMVIYATVKQVERR